MHTHGEIIDSFRAAMSESGVLAPDDIVADGMLHRFSTSGKRSTNKTGYYVLHLDGVPAGTFGDWRGDVQVKWRFDKPISKEDAATAKKLVAEKKRERAKEQAAKRAQAKRKAMTMLSKPKYAILHPYLERKRVRAHGTVIADDGRLAIPVYEDESLVGIQFIDGEGEKKFLYGTPIEGGCYMIGAPPHPEDRFIGVAEGFATAASIHESIGLPVAVAFNAGNLVAVARRIAHRYARAVVVFADDDWQTAGNPGLTYATKAVRAVRGALATIEPGDFGGETRGTDFNDLKNSHPLGAKLIAQAFIRAKHWSEL